MQQFGGQSAEAAADLWACAFLPPHACSRLAIQLSVLSCRLLLEGWLPAAGPKSCNAA